MPERDARPGQVLQLRTASAGGNASTGALAADHHCDLWNTTGRHEAGPGPRHPEAGPGDGDGDAA